MDNRLILRFVNVDFVQLGTTLAQVIGQDTVDSLDFVVAYYSWNS